MDLRHVSGRPTSADTRLLICPFDLRVERMAAMLNCELADHPVYDGIELQRFDDEEHGTGMLVFLSRRADRRVDFYVAPGLTLDPGGFAIGAGIGGWRTATFDVARLEVAEDGVDAEIRFDDVAGRRIEVRVDDRDGQPRRRARLLAPVSAGIEDPQSLLLVWMPVFDLDRTGGGPSRVAIDGVEAATGSLPGARWHGRQLIKYAADLQIVTLNRRKDGPVSLVDPAAPKGVILGADTRSIVAVDARRGDRRARLRLDPPLPDLAALPAGAPQAGRWRIGTQDGVLTGGTWMAIRRDDEVSLTLAATHRWRPTGLPPLMRVVTTVVPTFRRWPTTYRWQATVSLAGSVPTITGSWARTTGPDTAYRRLTRSRS